MPTSLSVNQPISFRPSLKRGLIILESIDADQQDGQWTDLCLCLRMDATTYALLQEQEQTFENIEDHPIAQGPRHQTLPIYLTIRLGAQGQSFMPSLDTDLVHHFTHSQDHTELLQRPHWTVIEATQKQVKQQASLSTVSTPSPQGHRAPSGPISTALEQALHRHELDYNYQPEREAFELALEHQGQRYCAQLIPQDLHFRLSLTLYREEELSVEHLSASSKALQHLNDQTSVGSFSINNQRFTYFEAVDVPRNYQHQDWILPLLSSALGQLHSRYADLLDALANRDA